MLDFSFSEILLCFVVALVVLGPERMPGLVRSLGRWAGKAKGYMRNLSAELERETQIAEMKKQIEDAHRILKDQSGDLRRTVEGEFKTVQNHVSDTAKVAKDAIGGDSAAKVLGSHDSPAENGKPHG